MTTTDWTDTTDTEAANIVIARRIFREGFGQGNLSVCDELFAADVVEHQRGNPSGVDGVKAIITTLRGWFPDFRLDVEDIVAREDMVWCRSRAIGTNEGGFMGLPPNGGTIDITVYDSVRIRDGRVVEHWGVPDQLGAALQLGLIPLPK
ncbi:ester cyclase [Gordonia rhizosphera]|uniref:SnoaL-like domain-containing protein n=1 Tax=Gordonia rhizosphera NBRC 16068 TaxID=1108045 RepID=K6WUP1_9ACTN|nr:ester cyclase [Gordonia rhizosphera]GAB90269.1 hypothetical protein GORHZ_092_00180 [Gordonia rhizosphera NBRC 16068]